MAIEKQINTRIQLKNDIEANWLKAVNFIPKLGELIIYNAEKEGDELPEGRDYRIEYPRFKVGDGQNNVNILSFSEAALDTKTSVQIVTWEADD